MAVVTRDQIFKMLMHLHHELDELNWKMLGVNGQIKALRLHSEAMALDLKNIGGILARHETQLERIERRIEMRNVAA